MEVELEVAVEVALEVELDVALTNLKDVLVKYLDLVSLVSLSPKAANQAHVITSLSGWWRAAGERALRLCILILKLIFWPRL